MKILSIALILSLGVVVAGCGAETAVTLGVLEAEAAKSALRQKGVAVSSLDLTKIQNAVQHYQAGTGAYPSSLEDLVPDYLALLPTKADGSMYAYDPATGKVGR